MLLPSTDICGWDREILSASDCLRPYRFELHTDDGKVVPIEPPSAEQLLSHEARFMPATTAYPGQSLTKLKDLHREAVRETAAQFGIELDKGATVPRLDSEGRAWQRSPPRSECLRRRFSLSSGSRVGASETRIRRGDK